MRIHYLAGAVVGLTCVVADPAELPLDGSTKSGTLSQNEYDYYTIKTDSSGDVHLTTTVTQNPIGVWTYVGRDYQPVDGNSDWNQGAIIQYPAKQVIENLEPNETYYVGVQGIGSPSASYTISATIDNKPYVPPSTIKVNDKMPVTSQIPDVYQYAFFTADIPEDGNYTVSIFPQSSKRAHHEGDKNSERDEPNSDDVYLIASGLDLPTLGKYQWINSTSHYNDWTTLHCPFLRKDSKLGVGVKTRVSQLAFYVKIDSTKDL